MCCQSRSILLDGPFVLVCLVSLPSLRRSKPTWQNTLLLLLWLNFMVLKKGTFEWAPWQRPQQSEPRSRCTRSMRIWSYNESLELLMYFIASSYTTLILLFSPYLARRGFMKGRIALVSRSAGSLQRISLRIDRRARSSQGLALLLCWSSQCALTLDKNW